jgi:hypothetical protein
MNLRFFNNKKIVITFHLLVLICFAVMVSISVSPHLFPRPNIDQGVYIYIGSQILDGKLPYRDLWDHKGFLIYYIYAFGLLINSDYGIWLLGILTLLITIGISYKLYYGLFDSTEAFIWTLTWLAGLTFVLDGGHTIEYFNLPLLFGSLYCTILLLKTHHTLFAILIGCLSAISAFLRPNEISVILSICLLCIFQALKEIKQSYFWLKSLTYIAFGFLLTVSLFLFFLSSQGLIKVFYDAFIHFNLLYSQANSNNFFAFFFGVYLLPVFFIISFTTWLSLMIKNKKTYFKQEISYFLVILFPIQILLSILSGRAYAHYFVSWLPVFSLMTSLGIKPIIDTITEKKLLHKSLYGFILPAFLITISISKLSSPFVSFVSPIFTTGFFPTIDLKNNPDNEYVSYVLEHTNEGDYVWFWGNRVIFNVQTNRQAPSRFIYPYPFGIPNYATPQLVNETVNDLENKKPTLIIDITLDDFAPINLTDWANHEAVLPLINYILENYHVTDYIGSEKWIVWSIK